MHYLTFLFASSLISTISAAPLPVANDALLEFQERAGFADDESFAQVARSLEALDDFLEERDHGFLEKRIGSPKPFDPHHQSNKLQKDKPVPKKPNPQPKTSNTIKKNKPAKKEDPSKNFRRDSNLEERDYGFLEKRIGSPKPFDPHHQSNKLQKDKPVPKKPNPQPKTSNTIKKNKPAKKEDPSKNFRRDDFLEERDDGFLEERDNGFLEKRIGSPKPFDPHHQSNKLQKDKPVPKKPNPQPKTSNTIKKNKPAKKEDPSKNFRRYYA